MEFAMTTRLWTHLAIGVAKEEGQEARHPQLKCHQ